MTDPLPLPSRRYTHPALFGLLVLPFGAAYGLLQVAIPFWLAALKMPFAQIATISAVSGLPHACKIFWTPLMDITGRRKLWYLVNAALVAALIAAVTLIRDPIRYYVPYLVLVTALQVAAATLGSALNALMAISPREEDKGRAGGFYMAGNVGGTSLLGALALFIARTLSPTAAGLILAALMAATMLGAFALHEPAESAAPRGPSALAAAAVKLKSIVLDIWATVKSREGLTGLIICLAPVGCGALTNLFSAMAKDYRASDGVVEMVNGLGGGIAGAVGSLVGGYLADKMNRRLCYALSGGLTALCAFAMAAAPKTPLVYAWGTLSYSFANGIAFAAFAGMVLEMVSKGAVATKYTLFVAVSNLAISYTTFLDGAAFEFHGLGTLGAVTFDGLITFAGIALLGAMVAVTRNRKPPEPAAAL